MAEFLGKTLWIFVVENVLLNAEFTLGNVWRSCLDYMASSGMAANAVTYLEGLQFSGIIGNHLFLVAPNEFTRTWIMKSFASSITKAMRATNPELEGFTIEVSKETPKIESPKFKLESVKKPVAATRRHVQFFYKNYSFANFIEGKCNKEALSLCKRVVLNPGEASLNPLYIYGASGLGKTHLLQAMGREIEVSGRNIDVRYCSAIQLLNDYVKQFQGTMNDREKSEKIFREKYENAGMLLIDDVQLLSKKDSTQKALLNIVERMRYHGRQVVFTSDRRPNDIPYFQQKLISRLEESFIVEISVPDAATRLQFVERDTAEFPFSARERREICKWIATPAVANFRELSGKICRLRAENELMHRELSLSCVRQLLVPDMLSRTIEAIADATAMAFGIKRDDLCSDSRIEKISLARKIAMYICREDTEEPLQAIGEFFGRTHSTVISSINSIANAMKTDEGLCMQIREIRSGFGTCEKNPNSEF